MTLKNFAQKSDIVSFYPFWDWKGCYQKQIEDIFTASATVLLLLFIYLLNFWIDSFLLSVNAEIV